MLKINPRLTQKMIGQFLADLKESLSHPDKNK